MMIEPYVCPKHGSWYFHRESGCPSCWDERANEKASLLFCPECGSDTIFVNAVCIRCENKRLLTEIAALKEG
jgi:predicted amidophosphoribosyltransferase